MEPIVWIILAVVLVAVVAAVVIGAQRKRRRAQLQERFGPEYDRAVVQAGGRRGAEQHLASVAERRDELELRELDPQQRTRYMERWTLVQARFVDEPAGAVDDADTLLTGVLRDRGYPVDDFDERADILAADHPEVVTHYRAAHASHERHRANGAADTEDLRQAFVHYRALFDAVIGRPDGDADRADVVPASAVPADRDGDVDVDAADRVQRADRTVDVTDAARTGPAPTSGSPEGGATAAGPEVRR